MISHSHTLLVLNDSRKSRFIWPPGLGFCLCPHALAEITRSVMRPLQSKENHHAYALDQD